MFVSMFWLMYYSLEPLMRMIIWPKCLEPLNCTSDNKYEDFKKAEELLGKIFTTATNEESFQNMGYGVQEASELSKIAKTRQYSANDGIMHNKYNKL